MPRWIRIGAMGGVAFLMTLGLILLQALIPKAEAGVLTIPNIFVFGETVGLHTKLNANFAAVVTSVNNITNAQIAANANISQSKIAGLSTLNTSFNDHSARHEPGGADEVGDIDILNTGTLLSVHASRHASGGADPIPAGGISLSMLAPGVISQDNRSTYIAETGLQSDTSFSNYTRTRYSSGAVANSVAKDLVYCNGFLYVAVDTTASTDFVTKVTASTMSAVANINLVAGDNPVDLSCGLDGSVYVLLGGTFVVKKISTGDVVSTVGTVTGADGVLVMVSDPNSTNLYILGSIGGSSRNQTLFRMVVSGGSVSSVNEPGGGAENEFTDLFWFNRNGSERIAVLMRDVTGASTQCKFQSFSNAAPPVVDDNTVIEPAPLVDDDGCGSMEQDGSYMLFPVVLSGTTITGFEIVDLGTGLRVHDPTINKIAVTVSNEPQGSPQNSMFDGRRFLWGQVDGRVSTLAPPNYASGALFSNIDMDGGMSGTTRPCGFGSDGVSTYVCVRNDANTEYIVTKQLGI